MKTKVKKLTSLLLALSMVSAMGAAISGCGNSESSAASSGSDGDGAIKIGTSFPLSGSVATDGKMIVTAIQMAVDEANAKGGVTVAGKKYTVTLDSQDDEGDPTKAATIANKFADDKDMMAVISSYNSSCMLAQVSTFDSASLPSISPVATSPDLSGSSKFFHRVVNSDTYTGKLDADVMKALGYKKVAALYEDDDYGQGLYDAFSKEAKAIGLTEAYKGTFVYGQTKDFSTLLTNVKSSGADSVFWGGLTTELGMYLSQSGTIGTKATPVYADTGCYSPAMITAAGKLSEGLVSVGCFDVSGGDAASQKFIADFTKAFGTAPSLYAALAYDAAQTLLTAMENSKELSREAINDALNSVDYKGITGQNKFDENGDVAKQYSVYQVKNSAWAPLTIQY